MESDAPHRHANEKVAILRSLAKKYIWWQSAEESMQDERRVVAQIMNIGDFEDVARAIQVLGTAPFEDALREAESGWFSPKSWSYWHYRCGLTPCNRTPPPMPLRKLRR